MGVVMVRDAKFFDRFFEWNERRFGNGGGGDGPGVWVQDVPLLSGLVPSVSPLYLPFGLVDYT